MLKKAHAASQEVYTYPLVAYPRNAFQPAKHQTPGDKNLGEGHRVPASLQRHLLEKDLACVLAWHQTSKAKWVTALVEDHYQIRGRTYGWK